MTAGALDQHEKAANGRWRGLVGAEGIEPPLLPCSSSALPMSYTPFASTKPSTAVHSKPATTAELTTHGLFKSWEWIYHR
jgi:hypothetical protein